MSGKPALQFIQLRGKPIFQQLQIEEACLRADNRNWCIINDGASPAIVMGISGSVECLVNQDLLASDPVPIVRRSSGGGTVFIDENTIFVTLICNSQDVAVPTFPKRIMAWTEGLYKPLLEGEDFRVQDSDYVLGDRKFGGNAQHLSKGRWLHHSSLLWDFSPEKMNYLQMPLKMPRYRNQRSHNEFLCRLRDYLPSKEDFYQALCCSLSRRFTLHTTRLSEIETCLSRPHRKGAKIIFGDKKNC